MQRYNRVLIQALLVVSCLSLTTAVHAQPDFLLSNIPFVDRNSLPADDSILVCLIAQRQGILGLTKTWRYSLNPASIETCDERLLADIHNRKLHLIFDPDAIGSPVYNKVNGLAGESVKENDNDKAIDQLLDKSIEERDVIFVSPVSCPLLPQPEYGPCRSGFFVINANLKHEFSLKALWGIVNASGVLVELKAVADARQAQEQATQAAHHAQYLADWQASIDEPSLRAFIGKYSGDDPDQLLPQAQSKFDAITLDRLKQEQIKRDADLKRNSDAAQQTALSGTWTVIDHPAVQAASSQADSTYEYSHNDTKLAFGQADATYEYSHNNARLAFEINANGVALIIINSSRERIAFAAHDIAIVAGGHLYGPCNIFEASGDMFGTIKVGVGHTSVVVEPGNRGFYILGGCPASAAFQALTPSGKITSIKVARKSIFPSSETRTDGLADDLNEASLATIASLRRETKDMIIFKDGYARKAVKSSYIDCANYGISGRFLPMDATIRFMVEQLQAYYETKRIFFTNGLGGVDYTFVLKKKETGQWATFKTGEFMDSRGNIVDEDNVNDNAANYLCRGQRIMIWLNEMQLNKFIHKE